MGKLLNKYEAKLKKDTKSWLLSSHEKEIFNDLLEQQVWAREKLERLSRAYEEAEQSKNLKLAREIALKTADAQQACSRLSKSIQGTQKSIKNNFYRLSGVPIGKPLDDYEKKVIAENEKIVINAYKLMEGTCKQILDYVYGTHKIILEAAKGNKEAQNKVINKVQGLITVLLQKYRASHIHQKEMEAFIIEAIATHRKNKNFSQIQWVASRLKTLAKERHCKDLKDKNRNARLIEKVLNGERVETFSGASLMQEELECEDQLAKDLQSGFNERDDKIQIKLGRKYRNVKNENDVIWIDQMADELGVRSQTLRNWDNDGTFKAERLKIGKREYRVYKYNDILKLRKIKEEKTNKRNHLQDKHLSLSVLAKLLAVPTKTIIRHENLGKLPQPKRSQNNYRIYTREDFKIYKKHFR